MTNANKELSQGEPDQVRGGLIVKENDDSKFWLIRQDGTVYAPAPNLEKALEFARTLSLSTEVITREEYVKRFGRELVW